MQNQGKHPFHVRRLKIFDVRFNGLLGVIHSLQVAKQVVNGRLLLCFHDVVSVGCEQQALQPLSPAVVSARAFRAVNHAHVCGIIVFFCLVFGVNFNILSTLSVHQSPTLPQKIDSREGWF